MFKRGTACYSLFLVLKNKNEAQRFLQYYFLKATPCTSSANICVYLQIFKSYHLFCGIKVISGDCFS